MNVLFVLYHDFTSNSAFQVHCLANELVKLGYVCSVAVPGNKESVARIGSAPRYSPILFSEVNPNLPDVVHCWTPREIVRQFHERVFGARSKARLVVHLEDNERHLAETSLGQRWSRLETLPMDVLDRMVPPFLSHPVKARQFLDQACGGTVIVSKLAEFLPESMPWVEIWPSADEAVFGPSHPIDWSRRERLGIPRETTVIVYTGNVHLSNESEVLSLYLAVALLNRRGFPAKLVRAGTNYCPFLEDAEWDWRSNSIELGQVDHVEIADVMSMADIFVQPGRPGAFNDYRFPSKVPEFCAIGRPVILPASNVGLSMRHGEDAYVLPAATGSAIADAVREIRSDAVLEKRLAQGARRFFEERLQWGASAAKLGEFYRRVNAFG